jgi:hypothetical protein
MSDRVADAHAAFARAGLHEPSLFIVGAMKSGTSSMVASLAQHPHIFMARGEPHYFGDDLERFLTPYEADRFAGLFAERRDEPVAGQKGNWYLRSSSAASEIRRFAPDARILILLRSPADMVRSLHAHFRRNGREDIADLREALAAEPDRRAGRRMPPGVEPERLLYTDAVDYGPQVGRFVDVFGPEQVRVLFFEEVVADPAAAMMAVQQLAGVEVDPELAYLRVNEGFAVRSPRLQEVRRRIARSGPSLRPVKAALCRGIDTVNRTEPPRAKSDPVLRAELAERFRPQVEDLSAVLKRDLPPAWGPGSG